MTDNYLDSFLSELEKANDGSKYYDALKRSTQLESDHFGRAVDLLKGKGYIKVYANEAMPATVTITSVGSKFLNDGGFKHETELKNSPLNAIKLSKWAIVISIIAIVVSIIAIYFQFNSK